MKDFQKVWTEKVVANLGGTAFLTETGKVIEGNYKVGDYAPVIYDITSMRFLPAWKKEVSGMPGFIEKEIESARGLTPAEYMPVFGCCDTEQRKIFFTVELEEGNNPRTLNYYMDFGQILSDLGHNDYNSLFYSFRLVEGYPWFGAVVYFRRISVNYVYKYQKGNIIKFQITELKTPVEEYNYNGVKYKKVNFNYVYENFSLMDDDVEFPEIDVQIVCNDHPDEQVCRRHSVYLDDWLIRPKWTSSYDPNGFVGCGYSNVSGDKISWDFPIEVYVQCRPDPWQNPDPPSYFSLNYHKYVEVKNVSEPRFYFDQYNRQWLTPVGSAVWLSGEKKLNDLKVGVVLYGVLTVEYDLTSDEYYTVSNAPVCYGVNVGEVALQYLPSSNPYTSHWSILVPCVFEFKSGYSFVQFLDLNDYNLGENWAHEWGNKIPAGLNVTHEENFTKYCFVPEGPYSCYFWWTWYAKKYRSLPTRIVRVCPIYDDEGEFSAWMVHYVIWSENDTEKHYFYSPSSGKKLIREITPLDNDINNSLIPNDLGFYYRLGNYYYYFIRSGVYHEGSGIANRHMMKTMIPDGGFYNESIYVIDGNFYGPEDQINFDEKKYPFGRVSRELLIVHKRYNLKTGVGVINTTYGGNFELKYEKFKKIERYLLHGYPVYGFLFDGSIIRRRDLRDLKLL